MGGNLKYSDSSYQSIINQQFKLITFFFSTGTVFLQFEHIALITKLLFYSTNYVFDIVQLAKAVIKQTTKADDSSHERKVSDVQTSPDISHAAIRTNTRTFVD